MMDSTNKSFKGFKHFLKGVFHSQPTLKNGKKSKQKFYENKDGSLNLHAILKQQSKKAGKTPKKKIEITPDKLPVHNNLDVASILKIDGKAKKKATQNTSFDLNAVLSKKKQKEH